MFFGTYIISHSVVRNIKYDDIDLKNASDEEKYAYVPYDLIWMRANGNTHGYIYTQEWVNVFWNIFRLAVGKTEG